MANRPRRLRPQQYDNPKPSAQGFVESDVRKVEISLGIHRARLFTTENCPPAIIILLDYFFGFHAQPYIGTTMKKL
jgi:hypothetical protein